MREALKDTISRGWPSMTGRERLQLTIREEVYHQYAHDHEQDPKTLFKKATQWISKIQENAVDKKDLIDRELHEAMIKAIFGSNLIERAGLNLDITVQLCRRVFAGEDVPDIANRDASYTEILAELVTMQPELKDKPVEYIIRSRKEVVQHARAFQHIIHAFVVEKQDLNEHVIKETHRILTKGVPIV
jgi:Fic family protein